MLGATMTRIAFRAFFPFPYNGEGALHPSSTRGITIAPTGLAMISPDPVDPEVPTAKALRVAERAVNIWYDKANLGMKT